MTIVRPFVKHGLDGTVIRPYVTRVASKKRRKTQAERKEDMIKVMVTSEQKRLFTEAATAAGLDLSNWLRTIALREAKVSGGGG